MFYEVDWRLQLRTHTKNELEDLPGEKMKPKELLEPQHNQKSQKVARREPTCAQGCPKAPKWSQKDTKKETR